jgi:hypothetical protein
MITKKVATTVKVDPALYDEFKVLAVRHRITLQEFFEKSVFRYVGEDKFRAEMNNFLLPIVTASWVQGTSSLA